MTATTTIITPATLVPLDDNRQRLAVQWLGLARKRAGEAYRRCRGAIPFDALLADALLGLVRAAASFDPWRGFAFSTYAERSIRWAVRRGIRRHFEHAGRWHQFATDGDSGASLDALVADRRHDAADVAEEHRDQLAEAHRRLERCLTQLERAIVELHFLDGLAFDAVGDRLGLSGSHAGELCKRAVERLRANRPPRFDEVAAGPAECLRRRLAREG